MLIQRIGCLVSRKLVIHIGAQKCASSSLQASLRLYQQSADGSMEFVFMNPGQLRAVDRALAGQGQVDWAYLDRVLSSTGSDQVVVSHEMLGNRPVLVRAIAERSFQRHGFEQVVVVGYTRLQSSYHISAFGQWYFRDQKRLRADKQVFLRNDLPWELFSALERSLFALVFAGQDRGWWGNYRKLRSEMKSVDGDVSVVSNHIPTREIPYLLLSNFFDLAGLQSSVDDLAPYDVRKNASFDPVLVHALSVHFSAMGQRESCFPGPHEGNRWLFRVCDRIEADPGLLEQMQSVFDPAFSHQMVQQINQRCAEKNQLYCQRMDVNPAYFQLDQASAPLLSADQLVDLVRMTAEGRQVSDVQAINRRCERLMMRAARSEIIST